MPVRRMKMGESPDDIRQRDTRIHLDVFNDIFIIVIFYESEVRRGPIGKTYGGYEQQRADLEDATVRPGNNSIALHADSSILPGALKRALPQTFVRRLYPTYGDDRRALFDAVDFSTNSM
jgi:hypothetical protein